MTDENRDRLLPTYRWDEKDKLSSSETELRRYTAQLLLDFRRVAVANGNDSLPPEGVIIPIAAMNVAKRSAATRRAEELIERGDIAAPPASLIPTFMAAGHKINGVEDGYLNQDHPSQELFAYNRLGKKSWLNRRFGEHCLKAIGFAHPHGTVERSSVPTRVKAYPSTRGFFGGNGDKSLDSWVVVASKTPIADIQESGRRASLISRVTGAIDLKNPVLTDIEVDAITRLSRHEIVTEQETAAVLGQKAVLLDALTRHDDTDESPFYPVIQTVYLTQLPQKS